MVILAIDPGPAESAWVLYDPARGPLQFAKVGNDELRADLPGLGCRADFGAVEMIASYGMAVGATVFETCVWIGRYIEAAGGLALDKVYRKDVKMHLCGTPRAKDGNIRQALIDRLGSPGNKSAPGRTYGISGDVWAALGVAVTYAETRVAAAAA